MAMKKFVFSAEYKRGEWNFVCGAQSIDKLHLKIQQQCVFQETIFSG